MRFVCVLLFFGLAACQHEDPRVKELTARLETAEKKIDQLEKRPQAAAMPPQRKRPDPNTVYNLPVRDDDLIRGNGKAKVTIVEGFDFACPFCAASRPAVKEALARHTNDVRVVSKQFVVHPDVATLPALAVCAARRQGKGPEVEDAIWAGAWTETTPGRPKLDPKGLAQDALEKVAGASGLDLNKFKADMSGNDCKQWLTKQQGELAEAGVNGTPAFFVNGRPYQGPRTADGFSAAIEEELKKAGPM